MANPFERPPGKPEVAVRDCPVCGGSGQKQENGKAVTCKRCNGTGQIRSNG
ncbi:MAG TPA: hypothetical protein VHD56_02660 [Tepidisphaeraceae bacterium]|nr:hypothetical protein [Tepidisphaeraceae bacterium]